jgi:hypothetical protein
MFSPAATQNRNKSRKIYRSGVYIFSKYIVTCTGVRVTTNNGSTSDDWIYWTFFVQSLLITSHTAPSLIYTLSSSPLHTHKDSQSPLVVSWQRISTQELSLQITMKSSSNFFFDHLGMPTQFSSSNSPVSVVLNSVLHGTDLYSTNLHDSPRPLHDSRYIDAARTTQKTFPPYCSFISSTTALCWALAFSSVS